MSTLQSRYPIDPQKPITTIDGLRNHLAQAAAVELSTVPLYLYAAYSIKTQGYKQWNPGISAFRAIRSVVIEEMLHLCLARNLLLAIDGADHVHFYDRHFVPDYPTPMLHRVPTLQLQLEPASPTLMREIFMPLEQPAATDAPPQPESYNTLGQFYAAIEAGFELLDGEDPETLWRDPHTDFQYDRAYWNNDGGGSPLIVQNLTTAKQAIATIVEQGEGAAPGDEDVPLSPADPKLGLNELSHYAKFSRIADGIDIIGETWPVPKNPRRENFDGPLRGLATLFDAAYCYVLCMIDAIYVTTTKTRIAGQHSPRYGLERTFIAAMGGLLFPVADLLVRQPGDAGANAGPGFGFYQFADGASKKDQLIELCDAVLGHYPTLGGDDGVRQLIARLPSV
jgi:ferritin-like protein